MRNQLIRIFSVLCAASMLFMTLPAALSESGEEAGEETFAAEEFMAGEQPAADEPAPVEKSAPAEAPAEKPAPVEEPVSVAEPVITEEPARETVPAAEPAPAEDAITETAPFEDSVPEEKSEEENLIVEETVPAEEPGEEPAPAEKPATVEGSVLPEEPVEEPAPADESVLPEEPEEPAEEYAPAEEPDLPEEPEKPAEENAAAEESAPLEEPEEKSGMKQPAELTAGNILSDVVPAGEEYKVLLKAPGTGTAAMKLFLEKERTLKVLIGDRETELNGTESGDPAWSAYAFTVNTAEGRGCLISLNAAEDTAFSLKFEFIAAETAATPTTEVSETEEPVAEEPETEEPAAEEPVAEEPATEEPAAEESADKEPVAEKPADEDSAAEDPEEKPADGDEDSPAEAVGEEPAAEEPAEEDADGEPAAGEPEESDSEASDTEDSGEEAAEESGEGPKDDPGLGQVSETDQEMLEAGYIQIMVIRENGTNVYPVQDDRAESVGTLACGDVVWAKPAGDFWGEVVRGGEEESEPLYLNLNNVVLLQGEIGYDLPIRRVKLTSTLEGLTEIVEGTWIIMTAEISGFMEDEITGITWQYRSADNADGEFCNIEDAHDFIYIYSVNAENVHNEWRIILTINS